MPNTRNIKLFINEKYLYIKTECNVTLINCIIVYHMYNSQ